MSSDAEADCTAPEGRSEATRETLKPKDKLPSEVWVLIFCNAVVALGYGTTREAADG